MDKARARRLAKVRREKIVAAQRRAIEGPLPDFVVLGTQRGGTSFFYRLLTEHPLAEAATRVPEEHQSILSLEIILEGDFLARKILEHYLRDGFADLDSRSCLCRMVLPALGTRLIAVAV